MQYVSSASDTDDDELRKVTTMTDHMRNESLADLEVEIESLKQERKLIAQEVQGPSPPRLPEQPPTPPTPPTPPPKRLKTERQWGPPENDSWKEIGDWLQFHVPQPELIRESPALIAINNQTLAIIDKLGLPFNFFKHDMNVPVIAERLGVIKHDIDVIETSRKRRIGE